MSEKINALIGAKLKERRKNINLSQSELAELIGISYQQLQKYENGTNRISVDRLVSICRVLNIPISVLFDGLDDLDAQIGEAIPGTTISTIRKKPLKILLVEDNSADEMRFMRVIDNIDVKTDLDVVRDGSKVLKHLKDITRNTPAKLPDVIFLDLSLPKVSGTEVLEALKSESQLKDIPVVCLSGNVIRDIMERTYELSGSGFIYKSMELKEFEKDLELALRYWAQAVILPRM